MLVRAREREHGARGRGRSLESFPLLKEVIGEREVRRNEGEERRGGERRGEERTSRVLKVATRKVRRSFREIHSRRDDKLSGNVLLFQFVEAA